MEETATANTVSDTSADISAPESSAPSELGSTLEAQFDKLMAADKVDSEPIHQEPKTATNPTTSPAPTSDVSTDSAPAPVKPPVGWTGEAKQLFSELPPRLQEEIQRRDLEQTRLMTKKSEEASAVIKEVAPYLEAVNENADVLAGANPADAVRALFTAQRTLDAQPVQGIIALMNSYGVSVNDLVATTKQPLAQAVDPRIPRLEQKLDALLNRQTATARAAQIEDAKARHASISNEIIEFAQEADQSGKLLRPYFTDLKQDIEFIARRLRQEQPNASPKELLAQAYEQATWLNPKVREVQLGAAKAKQIDDLKTTAEKAKRASAPIQTRASGGVMTHKASDLGSLLEQKARELGL